jgi:YesN/AraC family two-component response regulator
MKHACTLLDSTDIAVGLIGEAVGYRDKYFFSKMFKKRLGISPRSYRDRKNI